MLNKGGFTLPGEAGYEKLTMELAEKWGADCIRDSDGTQLSDEILQSGIPVYSTLCLVRSVNGWAKQHPDKLQRNFLISKPVFAESKSCEIRPMDGYFTEQFIIGKYDDPKEFWQVYDRTAGTEHTDWVWDEARSTLAVFNAVPNHFYTVSFLATRIWEEISMYNHITNNWDGREHLMAVEPRYPEVQEVLLSYLEEWLTAHPSTSIVRFTSLFYNFCWLWGSDPRSRNIFTDWGSYDFTANPPALRAFEKEYGYHIAAEDFVNMGLYRASHNPPSKKQLDWMEFTGRFVREFGRKCVDLVHSFGKKAYVFYDDTWIGIEPWSGHFGEFGFDGLIKCVFNAFEARLCADVRESIVKELRLHPYLFPTGLTGDPTFAPGGHPERDVRRYWVSVRRALLRVRADRIGLGGFLHLAEPFPAFIEEISDLAAEFRALRALHEAESPWKTSVRIGILQSWGALRTWNCAGHMHEHPELPLNHIHEALAGQPFDVRPVSLADAAEYGVPADIDVLINAGRAGDAWSGGDIWKDPRLGANINAFVSCGGGFIGVKEPAAAGGGMRRFRIADALGVDLEDGSTICFEKYHFQVKSSHFITEGMTDIPFFHNASKGVYALYEDTEVLAADTSGVLLSAHAFGKGRAVYMAGFTCNAENNRLLLRAVLFAAGQEDKARYYLPDDPSCECAFFEKSRRIALVNGSAEEKTVSVETPAGTVTAVLLPEGFTILNI